MRLAVHGGTPVRSELLVFGRPFLDESMIAAVAATMRTGWVGAGPRVAELEARFAAYLVGSAERPLCAAAVDSGTAALHLAMLAAGLGPGDEVIVPSMTFAATGNAVVHTGAVPVLVDVDPHTQNLTIEGLRDAVTPRTRAVVPVHFAGHPCRMDLIVPAAAEAGAVVIEDAAHCIEGWAQGRKVGTIGDATCFSFGVPKNITTINGGMVTTPHEEWHASVTTRALSGLSAGAWRRFSEGTFQHYEVVEPGYRYNLTDVNATIGLCQLDSIASWAERRREVWERYDAAFADLPLDRPSTPSPEEPGDVHARHLYILKLRLEELEVDRDSVAQAIRAENVGVGIHYRALHLQPYYRDRFGLDPQQHPVATDLSARTLSIPLTGTLSDAEVDDVIEAVRRVLLAYRRS